MKAASPKDASSSRIVQRTARAAALGLAVAGGLSIAAPAAAQVPMLEDSSSSTPAPASPPPVAPATPPHQDAVPAAPPPAASSTAAAPSKPADSPAADPTAWHYIHPALHGWGIGLFITGLVIDAVGTGLYIGGADSSCIGNSSCQNVENAGVALWVVGGITWATGALMWIGGSGTAPGASAQTTFTPYVDFRRDHGSAGLRLRF